MWAAALGSEGMAPSLAPCRRPNGPYTVTLSPAVYPPDTDPVIVASW